MDRIAAQDQAVGPGLGIELKEVWSCNLTICSNTIRHILLMKIFVELYSIDDM